MIIMIVKPHTWTHMTGDKQIVIRGAWLLPIRAWSWGTGDLLRAIARVYGRALCPIGKYDSELPI